MSEHYQHLGVYSDLVAAARRQQSLYPSAPPGPQTQALVREVLGFCHGDENPMDVKVEREWETGWLERAGGFLVSGLWTAHPCLCP